MLKQEVYVGVAVLLSDQDKALDSSHAGESHGSNGHHMKTNATAAQVAALACATRPHRPGVLGESVAERQERRRRDHAARHDHGLRHASRGHV